MTPDCVDREGFLESMILNRNWNKWRGKPYGYLGGNCGGGLDEVER